MVKFAYCNNTMLKRFVKMYRLVHIYMYVYVHVYYMWYCELGSAYVHLPLGLPCKVFGCQLCGVKLEVYGCVEG